MYVDDYSFKIDYRIMVLCYPNLKSNVFFHRVIYVFYIYKIALFLERLTHFFYSKIHITSVLSKGVRPEMDINRYVAVDLLTDKSTQNLDLVFHAQLFLHLLLLLPDSFIFFELLPLFSHHLSLSFIFFSLCFPF